MWPCCPPQSRRARGLALLVLRTAPVSTPAATTGTTASRKMKGPQMFSKPRVSAYFEDVLFALYVDTAFVWKALIWVSQRRKLRVRRGTFFASKRPFMLNLNHREEEPFPFFYVCGIYFSPSSSSSHAQTHRTTGGLKGSARPCERCQKEKPHARASLAYLAGGEALLKPLYRSAERIVLHQRLAGLLADLLLFVHRVGSLVPEAMTLTPGGRSRGCNVAGKTPKPRYARSNQPPLVSAATLSTTSS